MNFVENSFIQNEVAVTTSYHNYALRLDYGG